MFPEKTKNGILIVVLLICMVAGGNALANTFAPTSTLEAVSDIADRAKINRGPFYPPDQDKLGPDRSGADCGCGKMGLAGWSACP